MDTINFSLPESLKEFVVTQVSEGGYKSVSDYVGELIRAEQQRQAKDVIESEIRKGIYSGDATPMSPDDWEGIRDELRQRCDIRKSF